MIGAPKGPAEDLAAIRRLVAGATIFGLLSQSNCERSRLRRETAQEERSMKGVRAGLGIMLIAAPSERPLLQETLCADLKFFHCLAGQLHDRTTDGVCPCCRHTLP